MSATRACLIAALTLGLAACGGASARDAETLPGRTRPLFEHAVVASALETLAFRGQFARTVHAARPDSRARHDLVRRARVCHPRSERARGADRRRGPARAAASNRRMKSGPPKCALADGCRNRSTTGSAQDSWAGCNRIRTSISRDSRCWCSPRTGSRRSSALVDALSHPRLEAASIDAYRTGPGIRPPDARPRRSGIPSGGRALANARHLSARASGCRPSGAPGSRPGRRVAQSRGRARSSSASAAGSRARTSQRELESLTAAWRATLTRRQPRAGRRHREGDARTRKDGR